MVIGLLILLWIFVRRLRKRIIRRCFVEIVMEKGKKIPLSRFKKGSVDKRLVKRCCCLRVRRRYTTLLPIGERVSFFVHSEGKLRFRARIYDVFKVICCHCPDCGSITCIDAKRHSSISVIHGYWIKLKEQIKHRLHIPYESEFFFGEQTPAAVEKYGEDLRHRQYAQMDADGTLPPTVSSVVRAVMDELK